MKWPEPLQSQPENPASDAELQRFVETVFAPLTPDEARVQRNEYQRLYRESSITPPFSPETWKLPTRPLPAAYLDFLRSSNGGYFEGVNRNLDPLFTTREVRDYLLAYWIPQWMPETCPIGFDGGGTFYLLDLRDAGNNNDYPVIMSGAGCLAFDEALIVASSFAEFIDVRLGC